MLNRSVILSCLFWTALLVAPASLLAVDANPNASATTLGTSNVDRSTLDRALVFYENRKFVEAEKLFREVLAASDAGQIPQADAAHCLGPLTTIYQSWGRKDNAALSVAWKYHKYVAEKLADDPVNRDRELDNNSAYVVEILLAVGRNADAEKLEQNMLAAAEKHTEANPLRTLKWLWKLSQFYLLQENSEQAKHYGERTVGLAQKTIALAEQRQQPVEPVCVAALAAGYSAIDNMPEAIRNYTKLLKIQNAQNDAAGAVQTRLTLGSLCAEAGQFDQALAVYQDGLIQQRQIKSPSLEEGDLLARIAAVSSTEGQAVVARQAWEDAAAVYSQLLKRLESNPQAQDQLAQVLNQLQMVQQQAGHYSQAVEACRRLLDLRKNSLADEHPLTIAAKSDLGALYGATGNFELAIPLLTSALQYWQQHNPPANLKWARALNDLAVAERGVGSFNDAQAHLEKALELRQASLQADDDRLASSQANLASIYQARGLYAKAVALLDQA
ncbi:MAG TPA: tetratricopeptide repeat protein, partial [Pirellulales bacterium]